MIDRFRLRLRPVQIYVGNFYGQYEPIPLIIVLQLN